MAISEYGKLDIIFNSAGILGDPEIRATATDIGSFKNVFDINLFGAFLGAKHATRVMIPAKEGCIVFIASLTTIIYTGGHD